MSKGEDKLLRNAIDSIILGVQDSSRKDPRRVVSAIRNVYAGVLLLCKQVLWNASPDGSNGSLIYKDLKLKNDKGLMVPKSVHGRTIDRREIEKRFKDLGLSLDWHELNNLAKIRNDAEHLFIKDDLKSAKEALAAAMPIIITIFNNHLKIDPSRTFGKKVWSQLLKNRLVFDEQSKVCYESFEGIEWPSTVAKESLPFSRCVECGSVLVMQDNPKAISFDEMELRCMNCQEYLDKEEVFEMAICDSFPGDWHNIVKRGGTFPTTKCPNCRCDTWILSEDQCALCQSSDSRCPLCDEQCHPDELDDDEGICRNCINIGYQMSKD